MRIVSQFGIAMALAALACVSVPNAGPLAEGSTASPRITAVDTAHPPRSAWVQLDRAEYAVLLLVAPGHSATLLYPDDSLVDNRLSAGAHQITFDVPRTLVFVDSIRNPDRVPPARERGDSSILYPGRIDTSLGRPQRGLPSISPTAPVYLLLVTSPEKLTYRGVVAKTAGVSIPSVEMEALNAVAKAVKATIANEPRQWAGYYQRVELRRRR